MRREREGSTVAVAVAMLLGSALFHLILWPLGNEVLSLSWTSPPLPAGAGLMEVSLLDDPEDADAAKEDERDSILPGKLVNLDRVVDERAPDKSDKIAEFDSRVEKEVRAPSQRPQAGEQPVKPGDHPDADNAPPSLLHPRQPADKPASAADGKRGEADAGDGDDAPAIDVDRADDGRSATSPGAEASPAARPGIRGTREQMRELFGRPGTMDDLRDVDEEGSESLLNAKRFKFSSFFNRVRDAVGQYWHPEVVHAARDPDGRIYGTKTRITRLLIRLHPDGSLQGIKIDRSSDVDFLDEEAIRAVRSAAPFSNPPDGLINPETGYIDFGFAFIFEIGTAPRIHRYKR